jgi:hypothetical protein
VVIHCYFRIQDFVYLKNAYICDRATIIYGNGSVHDSVSEIAGTHIAGKKNKDVESLQIINGKLYKIPSGIEKFFPNLRLLWLQGSNLSSLSSTDLQFPSLIAFRVSNSKLKTVDGNLFENNPNLNYIALDFNQIKNVGYNLLTGLKYLKEVNFRINPCISTLADLLADTPEKIQELNIQLPISCPPLVTEPPPTTTTAISTVSSESPSGCPNQDEMLLNRIIELERKVREITSNPCSCGK